MNRYIRISIPIILAGILALGSVCVAARSGDTETYDASRVSLAAKQEVMDFLASDATNDTAYNWVTYNCLNFAVDLWHNAYLAGFDAFLIILNKKGIFSHVCLGFYAEDGNSSDSAYWFDRNGGCWFYVDPQKDYVYSRHNPEDIYGEYTIEIITFIYGEDAFNLWQEVSGKTLGIELIRLYRIIWLYKVGKVVSPR